MPHFFADHSAPSIPLHLLMQGELDAFLKTQDTKTVEWIAAQGFTGGAGQICTVPLAGGGFFVIAGLGGEVDLKRTRFGLAQIRSKLPEAIFHLETSLIGAALEQQVLGWLFAGYAFDRYADQPTAKAQLIAPEGIDQARLEVLAVGEFLTRDLINTPASDMGPDELAQAAQELASKHGASCDIILDQDLLDQNFPMIHTVGRASIHAPRLIDMRWGASGPKLTLVGKGVCFDTGGLNLKPGASMGLMKKDMGGAATVLGLAHMIMALGLNVQLRVLIPAVENSVSANAFRPQDILTSRKGLTVEINNTDAEGRLVLADALALADEEKPDLIISMATLTGAARVALGPDLSPFYATDQCDALALNGVAQDASDPVWQMPFWDPYEKMIEPGIAHLDNAPSGGMAGSITAALFLRRFVTNTPRYMHFDIYGWCPSALPGRTKGGVGMGARAVLAALPELLKND
ncbi:leucyl aminopeptidase [Pacificibacter maritimus]|uniref:Leucyl aminopeptidase n=1 Tax=Pacificibacter maritimus TaxID=762213 RepID=A0A3N4UCW2_9RHOB|nr:leucyl aminopeptidase family protein [Pacificibacter maritimus]RPE63137.1 leucyl aminopeptidase [Pacificibacter maritimus]